MQNPVFWSSVGFWILVVGLVGEAAVILFVHSGRLEKALSVICTVVIIAGVAVEHVADAKRFSSRTLTHGQQAEVAATLKPFAGTPFNFAVQTDSEPIALMEQIAAALKSAGWIRKKWSGGGSDIVFNPPGGEPQAGTISSQGLEIQVAESRLPDFGTAAGKLYLALKAADLAIRVLAIPDAKGVKPDAIHILIGTKP